MKNWFLEVLVAFTLFLSPLTNIVAAIICIVIVNTIFSLIANYREKKKDDREDMVTEGYAIFYMAILKVLMFPFILIMSKYIQDFSLMNEIEWVKVANTIIISYELKVIGKSTKSIFGFSIIDKIKELISNGNK